jgi:hypothetical protein
LGWGANEVGFSEAGRAAADDGKRDALEARRDRPQQRERERQERQGCNDWRHDPGSQRHVKGQANGAVIFVVVSRRRNWNRSMIGEGGLLDGREPKGALAGVLGAMEVIQSAAGNAGEGQQCQDGSNPPHGIIFRGSSNKINFFLFLRIQN